MSEEEDIERVCKKYQEEHGIDVRKVVMLLAKAKTAETLFQDMWKEIAGCGFKDSTVQSMRGAIEMTIEQNKSLNGAIFASIGMYEDMKKELPDGLLEDTKKRYKEITGNDLEL